MATRTNPIVARARAMVGVRFRPHGRTPDHGVDCIGLVALAAKVGDIPSGYALRGGSVERLDLELRGRGFRPRGQMKPGDVLAMRSGPAQLHLGIWTGTGIVHADASLRRVVERPGAPPWPMLGTWRKSAGRS